MDKELRVLLIEDSPNDARILTHELKRAGYDPIIERVETAEDMLARLNDQAWDIILSDYGMPLFTATEALEVLSESGRDIPFIIVSGTIGETRAVEAMRAGAHDYVMKDNLSRLVPAIEREILESEVRRMRMRAEAAVRESEERFRTMADSAPALIWLADSESNFFFVNRTWLDFTGRVLNEELFSGWMQKVHPDDLENCAKVYNTAFENRLSYITEFRLRRADGEWRWMLAKGTPRFLADKTFAGYVGLCIDLTENKVAEHEREQVRAENERLLREQANAAVHQRALLRDILSSVTEGRLILCDEHDELPNRLAAFAETIHLTPPALRDLRNLAQEAAIKLGIDEERRFDLVTAASEAGMNAVVHGGGGEASVHLGADRVQVWVEDRGSGIDLERLPRAALERGYSTASTLGHGFFMMLATVDRIYLSTGPKGTTVVVEKHLTPPDPAWLSHTAN